MMVISGPFRPDLSCPIICRPIGAVFGAATKSVFDGFVLWVADAASWLVLHLVTLVAPQTGAIGRTTTPDLSGGWFEASYREMLTVGVYFMLPMLMAATIGAVVRQDLKRLARAWCVHLPLSVLGGTCAIGITSWALALCDGLCSAVTGSLHQHLATSMGVLASALVSMAVGSGGTAGLVAGMVAFLAIVGGLMLWCELLLRSAAVYVALVFMPIALAGLVWPTTAHWARRLLESLVALIFSKFVIVVVLSLALSAISADPVMSASNPNSVLSGGVMLLLAAFAPFSLLKLVPVIEAGAVAHLEGLSRRPARAVPAAAANVQGVRSMIGAMAGGEGSDDEEGGAASPSWQVSDAPGGELERAEAEMEASGSGETGASLSPGGSSNGDRQSPPDADGEGSSPRLKSLGSVFDAANEGSDA